MRLSGAFLLVLLIALAIVLMLRAKEVEHIDKDLQSMLPHLAESGVEGTVMSHREARARIDELEGYCRSPYEISNQVNRLREVAAEAAAWAAGAPSPSLELTVAVTLRTAADALREYAVRPTDRTLARAEAQLREARQALDGERPAAATSTDALRDRIRNIEQSHREKLQDLDEIQ